MNIIPPPPDETPFENAKRKGYFSDAWVRWFQNVATIWRTLGVGNGAAANVQAPAIGTGAGPANPNLIVQWQQVQIGTKTFWIPLCQ